MSAEKKQELAERRAAKRAERIDEEQERSAGLSAKASARAHRRVEGLRRDYFRRRYPDNWREVMAERAAS